MEIPRRILIGMLGACVCGAPARAADKVVAGSLGGQAPLWPFYIAAHKGFFVAEGLDVEIGLAQSGAGVTQQLTGGSLDVALSVGINDPIRAIDKGAPLALVRIVGDAAPYVLIGKAGLKTIADLKGKTVSIGQTNDLATYYFERMVAANGLNKEDYTALSAGVAASRYAALRAGVADAAIVLPPLNFIAAKAGYVTLGYAADYVKNLPFTGMAVFKPWAAEHIGLAKRVLTATDQSIAWLAEAAHREEAIELLVNAAHSSREDADASYDFLRRIGYFQPNSKISRAKLQNVIDLERRTGNVDAALTVDRLAMPGVTEFAE